ncbi:hypothetical protein ES703_57737 [subsurface metagenome]
MSIESVMRKYEAQLIRLPNVTGVGIGEKKGKEVIIVFVRRKVSEAVLQPSEIIPEALEGYETNVEEEIRIG